MSITAPRSSSTSASDSSRKSADFQTKPGMKKQFKTPAEVKCFLSLFLRKQSYKEVSKLLQINKFLKNFKKGLSPPFI